MKTITLTVPDDATITVNGVPYPVKAEVKLWTPKMGNTYSLLHGHGNIANYKWGADGTDTNWLEAGNIHPTREYAEALDRKRRAESIIFRYFYERGIDTRWKEDIQWSAQLSATGVLTPMNWNNAHGHPFYVESQVIAEQAINDIPDAIRTALMGGWV